MTPSTVTRRGVRARPKPLATAMTTPGHVWSRGGDGGDHLALREESGHPK
jgi:hypothetical protein